MAEFTVRPQAQAPGSYVGMSQGIYADRNNALGALFSNLADVGEQAVQSTDAVVQEGIQEDIFNEVDLIQQEFGVASATNLEEDVYSENPTPQGVTQAVEHIQGLQSAYEAGNLRESHYWARLNSMVRQLRGRYPGYRQEIDSMVSSTVGGNPANNLRSALFSEWAADARSGDDDPLGDLEDWATKNGRLPEDYYVRQSNGDPYSFTQLQAHIANKQRLEADRADRRAAMAEETDAGNLTADTAERNFRIDSQQFVTTLIQDSTSTIGKNYQTIHEQLNQARRDAANGRPWDQETITQLGNAMEELYLSAQQALQEEYFTNWDGQNPNHSYQAHLSTDTRNQIIADALAPINLMRQAVGSSEGLSLMDATVAYTESLKTDAGRRVMENIPFIPTLTALTDLAGTDVSGMYMSLNPEMQEGLAASMLAFEHSRAGLGEGTISEALSTAETNNLGSGYVNGLVDRWVNVIDSFSNGELTNDMIRNNVSYMFGDDSGSVMAYLDDASKFEYFRKVASPRVTRQMAALRDAGDVDSWNAYQQWVSGAFINLFQGKIDDLNNDHAGKNWTLEWDSNNQGFSVVAGGTNLSQNWGWNMLHFGNAPENLDQLNAAIRSIAPIITENDGQIEGEMYRLLEGMGYDPDSPAREAPPVQMMNALESFFGGSNGD